MFFLSHQPLLIDEGRKSFSLEKWTGKKCYFLGARDLTITWGDTPEHWGWTSLPESKFPEVARLKVVWWLEIWGTISYTAYFVYKLEDDCYGFDTRYMVVSVGISGVEYEMPVAYLHPEPRYVPAESDNLTFPKLREDGWFELELGEYFTGNEDDCIEFRLQDVKTGGKKRGLIVEGIDTRPKVA